MINYIIMKKYIFAAIAAMLVFAGAHATDFATSSLLASGKWVKVKVSREGIQQISYDQLRQWGFSDPSRVAVFGHPGVYYIDNAFTDEQLDDLVQTPVMHTSDGRVLFYGVADRMVTPGTYSPDADEMVPERKINIYAGYSTYFITDSQPPVQIATYGKSDTPTRSHDTHMAVDLCETDRNSLFGSGIFYAQEFGNKSEVDFTFDLTGYAPEGVLCSTSRGSRTFTYAALRYTFYANSERDVRLGAATYPIDVTEATEKYRFTDGAALKIVVDEDELRRFNVGTGNRQFTPAADIPADGFSIKFHPQADRSGSILFGAVDYATITFPRANDLTGRSQMIMHFMAGTLKQNVRLRGTTADSRVWDVTTPGSFTQFELNDEGDGVRSFFFNKTNSYISPLRVIAFDAAAQHLPVEYVGEVPNQNLHAESTPDMVVITTQSLYPSACVLADAHRRYQGLDVRVYTQDQVFNEFSSGTPAVMAYRRLLKMLYDRNPGHLKYLLLYGAGSYDNRGLTVNPGDYLLTYVTDNVSDVYEEATTFASDAYFGMLADNYVHSSFPKQKQHVSVGRIPFTSSVDCEKVNNKLISYLQNPPQADVFTRAVYTSGTGDDGAHYSQSRDAFNAAAKLSPALTIFKIPAEYYGKANNYSRTREMSEMALKQGVGYFTYSGHGGYTGGNTWTMNNVISTSYDYAPFAMMTTCSSFIYHRLARGMAEEALLKEHGGMIGVVGSSCPVFLDFNGEYNVAMASAFASAPFGSTIGDVMLAARVNMELNNASDYDCMRNALSFNLCGDPAIPVSFFAYNIRVNQINGAAVQNTDTPGSVSIDPGQKVTVSGEIIDSSGQRVSDYAGTVVMELYDAPFTTKISAGDGVTVSSDTTTVTFDQEIIARASAQVVDGLFTAEFFAPVTGRPGLVNRMVVSATPTDGYKAAAGQYKGLSITGNPVPEQSLDAPVIDAAYINDISFADGDVVPASFTLYADITAPAGVSGVSNQVGAMTTVRIDGKDVVPFAGFNVSGLPGGKASLACPVNSLAPGSHMASISVSDNLGRRADALVRFVVADENAAGEIEVAETPARDKATITLSLPVESKDTRIFITDAAGSTVYTARPTGTTYTWDLTCSDGSDVPEGFYSVHAIFTDGVTAGSTPAAQIIVVR